MEQRCNSSRPVAVRRRHRFGWRSSHRLVLATGLVLLASCGGGGDGAPVDPGPPVTTTGSLAITVSAPSGATASIAIAGPSGFSRTLSASETLTSLSPGSYTITASAVNTTLYDFAPSAAVQTATVVAGSTASTTVTYSATTGAIALNVAGLPTDRTGSVTITGASGARTVSASQTIGRLTPGSYTITPASVADVSLRYAASVTSVVVAGGATANASATYALPVAARSTADRTDDNTGSQLKVLYVLPSDGVDRALDTLGVLQRSVSSWQRWLSLQTSGRVMRLDTFGGGLDVQFVRLPRTDAVYRAFGALIRDSIEKDLTAAGVSVSASKLYLAYYDGGHIDRCGSAAYPPLLPGRVAALYLQGTIAGGPNCNTNAFASTPTSAPGYLEFVGAHETMHLLGLVSSGAPDHGFTGHTITDPSDLMYAGTAPWTPSKFDSLRRNYFNPNGLTAGLLNFAASVFTVTP